MRAHRPLTVASAALLLTTSCAGAQTPAPALVTRSLLVNYMAADYDQQGGIWANRVAAPYSPLLPQFGHALAVQQGSSLGAAASFAYAGGATSAAASAVVTYPLRTTFGPGNSPAVYFDWRNFSLSMRLATMSSYMPGIYEGSNYTVEMWVASLGVNSPSCTRGGAFTCTASAGQSESPVLQWGARPAATCASGFISLGNNPTWGAGGHWNCDVAYGPSNGTTQSSAGGVVGYTPVPYTWHHVVNTYDGNGTEALYFDGALMRMFTSRVLTIAPPGDGSVYLGAWYDDASGSAATQNTFYMAGAFLLGALRIHDGALSGGDVATNYDVEAPLYSAAGESSCPSTFPAWASWEHPQRAVTLALASAPTTMLRHYCYWIFTQSGGTTGTVALDSTFLVRPGFDGAPGSISFCSVNYPNVCLAPTTTLVGGGYALQHQDYTTLLVANKSAWMSWMLTRGSGGGFVVTSRAPPCFGWAITPLGGVGTACGTSASFSVVVVPDSNTSWLLAAPAAPASAYAASAAPWQTSVVFIESLQTTGTLGTCAAAAAAPGAGGGVSVAQSNSWAPLASAAATGTWAAAAAGRWILVPPLACNASCGASGPAFSLQSAAAPGYYAFIGTSGALLVGRRDAMPGGWSTAAATFIGVWTVAAGVGSGWLIIPATAAAAQTPLYLTLGAAAPVAGCAGLGVAAAPLPHSGVNASHFWRLSWEDGSSMYPVPGSTTSGMSSLPIAPCPRAPSSTPTPSATALAWARAQCGPADIVTPWGRTVDPYDVLPEYPRPQLVRNHASAWQNLNGLWEFAFGSGPDDAPPFGSTLGRHILVPFPPESCLSGIGASPPAYYSWYRLRFNTSAALALSPGPIEYLLNFGECSKRGVIARPAANAHTLDAGCLSTVLAGAVDWNATVWLNGALLGRHSGGFTHFTMNATGAIFPAGGGLNELILWVFDPSDNGYQVRAWLKQLHAALAHDKVPIP